MRFSICIPAYNVSSYLKQCINSVLAQTYSDYEVIIVDDGSSDTTNEIADCYSNKYANIRVIHQINTGLFHARITAMKASQGDYIIHLDADDWLESEALYKINDEIQNYNADVVLYNNYISKDNQNRKEQISLGSQKKVWMSDTREVIEKFFNTGKIQAIWKKAIKKSIINLEKLEKLPRITMTEDWIHSYYPLINAKVIVYIPDTLYNYRINANSMCKKFDPLIYESTKLIHEMQNAFLESNTDICQDINPERWLLVKIAKALIYNLSEVTDKNRYYLFLSKVYEDTEIKNIFVNYRGLEIKYRIPLEMLYKKQFKQLYDIKRFIVFVRKHVF